METIKSYTDLEQSKKLAKILPLESADYTHLGKDEDNVLTRPYLESCSSELKEWIGKDEMYPCWSLAALLGVLPNDCSIDKENGKYVASYLTSNECGTYTNDNPIDACYEVILYLHSLNLL